MKKTIFLLMIFFILTGCNNSSSSYEKGMEAYKQSEFAEAIKLFDKACDEEDTNGCVQLGEIYAFGQVVRQNHSKAIELFNKACDLGDAGGCHNLGLMYAKGRGVKRDLVKGRELHGKACDGGNINGCKLYEILGHLSIFKEE